MRMLSLSPLKAVVIACVVTMTGADAGAAAVAVRPSGPTPLYEVFELTFNAREDDGNPFAVFPTVTFTREGRRFTVAGFYDGARTWRARFMPDDEGTWSYTWSFQGASGGGRFECEPRQNPLNHGHVRRHSERPRALVTAHGTTHYWFGGKWLGATAYGPSAKDGQTNGDHHTDEQLIAYLDELHRYRHNGVLLKVSLFPLENDQTSWDLSWIRRGEWLLAEAARRGIYCQISLFDTWGRDRRAWFKANTAGARQVFNVWAPGDEEAKENYIRYVIARFASFYNVYWELGNEMEHHPNDGVGFARLANAHYIPWIRKYDPYGLPIGLSEDVWRRTGVDVGFLHQPDELAAAAHQADRPLIMNEPVRGCPAGPMWRDDVIRNPRSRSCYRRTFWEVFVHGGAGSSQATWLDVRMPINPAVRDVMADQQRLRDFVEGLPVDINEMETDPSFVMAGPGAHRTRRKRGEAYVTYFFGTARPGGVTVQLPPGTYAVSWYQPATGDYIPADSVTARGPRQRLAHPGFARDLVLRIVRESMLGTK